MQYVSQKARFSRCKTYRYSLQRSWETGQGSVVFIGLNPSTADHHHDDPTIRRCVGFAKSWGFNAMEIVNLFAYRATLPSDLLKAEQPIGPANDRWINKAIAQASLTIACWGNDGQYLARDEVIMRRHRHLSCIRQNKSAAPAHPLYLKASMTPTPLHY